MKCSAESCTRDAIAKGLCNAHYLRQKRHGSTSAARRAKGTFTVRPDGYRMVTRDGEQVREHVALAEGALGRPLPKAAQVHHVDGNPSNNAPGNLVICPSQAYHLLLHVRTDALAACGNASWRKCVHCKEYDAIERLSRHGAREAFYHKACAANYQRNRSQR